MEIEEVKTWQWMLAGLVAGFLFSCIVAWSGPRYDSQNRDAILTTEFESKACPLATYEKLAQDDRDYKNRSAELTKIRNYQAYHKDLPLLRNVIAHPPLKGDSEHRWCVTGEYYFVGTRVKDPAKPDGAREMFEEWKPFEYAAGTPYAPGYTQNIKKEIKDHPDNYLNGWVPRTPEDNDMADLKKSLGNKETFPTVVEYLKAVQALPNSRLTFKQSWWEFPAFLWSMPPLAGFLWIGVAWPMTLSILQNLGVAKRAPVKGKPKPLKKPELMNIPSTAGVILTPVAPPPPPPPPPPDIKEYGGEFYPVVKVHHEEVKPAAAKAPVAKPKPAPAKAK